MPRYSKLPLTGMGERSCMFAIATAVIAASTFENAFFAAAFTRSADFMHQNRNLDADAVNRAVGASHSADQAEMWEAVEETETDPNDVYSSRTVAGSGWSPWDIITWLDTWSSSSYGGFSDRQRLSPENALSLYQCLHIVNGIFAERNVTYWAGGGTLLGALRNKGLIPNDDDIDLHIPETEFRELKDDPEFKATLELNGLTMFSKVKGQLGITNASARNDKSSSLKSMLLKKSDPPFWIDIFAMKLSGDKWKFVKTDPRRNYFFRDRWFHGNVTQEPFIKLAFGTTTVPAPSRELSEPYVAKVYGESWNTTTGSCKSSFHHCHLAKDKHWALTHHAEPDGPLWDAKLA